MSDRIYEKKTLTLILAVSVFILQGLGTNAAGPAQAEPQAKAPVATTAMSLRDCIDTAIASNPGLNAARNGALAAEEAAGAARSGYLPRLDFQAGYKRWENHAFLPDSIQNLPFGPVSSVIGPTDSYNLGISGSYTLFDSGRRKSTVRGAEAMKDAAGQSASQTGQDVVMGVYSAYYGLLAAKADLDSADKSLKRSNDHLRLAEERKSVGAVPLADVLRARVGVANSKLALVSAKSAVDIAKGNLNTAMGRPAETPLAILDDESETTPPGKFSVEEAMNRAINNRPDLQAAISAESAKKEGVSAAKSAYGPSVVAQAAYGRLDSSFFPYDKDWAVGVAVRIPVFTGFERGHKLALARAELSKAGDERLKAELAVRQEVWIAHANVVRAYNSFEAVKALITDAGESLRMADERYKVGAGTITDLLDAETNMVDAQSAFVRSIYGCRVATAELQRAEGVLGGPEF